MKNASKEALYECFENGNLTEIANISALPTLETDFNKKIHAMLE